MEPETNPNNAKVIHAVVFTVCFSVIFGIIVEGLCMVLHIPVPSDQISGAFIHTLDTFVGAVIGMLIKTTPQSQTPKAEITNTEKNPVPVDPSPHYEAAVSPVEALQPPVGYTDTPGQ